MLSHLTNFEIFYFGSKSEKIVFEIFLKWVQSMLTICISTNIDLTEELTQFKKYFLCLLLIITLWFFHWTLNDNVKSETLFCLEGSLWIDNKDGQKMNRPTLIIVKIMKNIVSSASEAKISALCTNIRFALSLQVALDEMDYK